MSSIEKKSEFKFDRRNLLWLVVDQFTRKDAKGGWEKIT